MSSSLIALAAERTRELPVPAAVIGLATFALLCLAMVGLLMFGKGRPHS